MSEHIPSNPEHTVIRGDSEETSYHCDRTNTCHWSARLCKGGRVWDGLRVGRKRKWRYQGSGE